jgi:hypothetical protein
MRKFPILFAFIFWSLSLSNGQDITVSKDSMQVYNNSFSSYADQVMFTSHSSATIRLDSAFVFISQMDTVGYGRNGLELAWTPLLQASQQFVWTMTGMGQDSFRLVKKVFYPLSSAEPLFFSGVGTGCPRYFLQIGSCFQCDVFPKYPRYLRGTLRFFFSNGQSLDLRLWSQDLRTAVRKREVVVPTYPVGYYEAQTVNGKLTTVNFYSINGKNITTEVMKGNYFQRNGIVVVKVMENGRSYYLKKLLVR